MHFEPIRDDSTRVTLKMAYDPQGVAENIGDALGVLTRHVERTLEDFKEFIKSRGRETGAWRGEVRGGQTTG